MERPGRNIDPELRETRARLLARVHAIILPLEWGEPDEPIIPGTRQRRPSKRKDNYGK